MVMSKFVILGAACGMIACTQSQNPNERRKNFKSNIDVSMSDEDAYLLDMADAAATDDASGTVHVGASVAPDLDDQRLNGMADRLMSLADADQSGTLTFDEFIEGSKKLRKHHGEHLNFEPTEEQKSKMQARMKADFDEFAGADALLSSEELVSLLVYNAPRICHHREGGRGYGRHEDRDGQIEEGQSPRPPRQEQSWDQIVAKYDKNADGLLSKEEFEAFRAERHPPRH